MTFKVISFFSYCEEILSVHWMRDLHTNGYFDDLKSIKHKRTIRNPDENNCSSQTLVFVRQSRILIGYCC